ncbi:hypothetical protein HID58_000874, partial [Brassica napus]
MNRGVWGTQNEFVELFFYGGSEVLRAPVKRRLQCRCFRSGVDQVAVDRVSSRRCEHVSDSFRFWVASR